MLLAKIQIKTVVDEIEKAGFSINFDESVLEPASVVTFLGVDVDLEAKTLVPSEANIKSCIDKAVRFCNGNKKSLKNFQSLVGTLNFAAPFVKYGKLNLAPLHRFSLYFSNEASRRAPAELCSLLHFWMAKQSYVPDPIPSMLGQ